MRTLKVLSVLPILLVALAATPATADGDSLYNWWIGLPAPTTNPSLADTINVIQWKAADGGNDHWYAVLDQCLHWVQAYTLAPTFIKDGRPGYLATITSSEENAFIFDSVLVGLTTPCILDEFQLGGIDLDSVWTWITGEPFAYTNWNTNEPNNVHIENALGMWGPGVTDSRAEPSRWNNSLTNACVNSFHLFWSVIEWGDPEPTAPVAVCGNGILDPREDCDDGNVIGGDGCSPCCETVICGGHDLGDVDCDGFVDLRDVVHLGNILDGLAFANSCSVCTGDVNEDGAINEDDYNQLYDWVAQQ